jgi:uncharacterized membrane protein
MESPMQKPVSMTVLGVLNLVFALIGLLSTIASTLVMLSQATTNPVYVIMAANPTYRFYVYASLLVGVALISLLAAGGIGLLLSKAWGRICTILYAIGTILTGLISVVVNYVFLIAPLVERSAHTKTPEEIGALGGAIGGTLGGCFGLLYPVILLIFMYRKNVVQFFNPSETTPSSDAPAWEYDRR